MCGCSGVHARNQHPTLGTPHQQKVIKMKFMHVAFACFGSPPPGPWCKAPYNWAKILSSSAADTADCGSVSRSDRSNKLGTWLHGTRFTTGRAGAAMQHAHTAAALFPPTQQCRLNRSQFQGHAVIDILDARQSSCRMQGRRRMSVKSSCAANTHRAARQGAPNVRKSASIFRLHRYRILLFYLSAYNYFHEKNTITHLLYARDCTHPVMLCRWGLCLGWLEGRPLRWGMLTGASHKGNMSVTMSLSAPISPSLGSAAPPAPPLSLSCPQSCLLVRFGWTTSLSASSCL